MFEAVYGSTWHHPVAFWAVGIVVLAFLAVRLKAAGHRRVLGLLLAFQLLIVADAWLTSSWSPFAEGTPAKTAVAVTFVILGDLRYLLLLQRFGLDERKARSPLHGLALPIAASLIVPIASKVVAAPWADQPRVLFLVSELMFATLAVAVLLFLLPRRRDARAPGWVKRLTQFEIAQYVLWAGADVVILSGHDVGYLLRLLPNAMYYALFVPFAWWSAPEELVS